MMTEIQYDQRQYYDEVHRVTVRRNKGEPLGLTVKVEGECVIVSRIMEGGLIDRTGKCCNRYYFYNQSWSPFVYILEMIEQNDPN